MYDLVVQKSSSTPEIITWTKSNSTIYKLKRITKAFSTTREQKKIKWSHWYDVNSMMRSKKKDDIYALLHSFFNWNRNITSVSLKSVQNSKLKDPIDSK